MGWLYRYSIGHPRRVILVAAVISLATAPGILRLKIQTDGHALVPKDAEEIRTDRSIRDEFGVEDPIVVLIQSDHPKGIFNLHTIRLVHELTHSFMRIRGVRAIDLFSLETEHGDRVQPGTLHFRRFLEPMPTKQEQLDTLRDDLRAIELYTGTLVSYDEKATSILVGVPKDADRTAMYQEIRGIVDAQGPIPEEIHVIGAPVAEALLGTHILEDLGVPDVVLGSGTARSEEPTPWRLPRSLFELRLQIARHIGLVPIAIAIMAAVFLVSFRSFAAAMLPLSEVGACLLFVFGLMGWLEVPVYLTVAVLPIILTAMGIADEIHIFRCYSQHLRERGDGPHEALVTLTMEEMCVPVVKTSVTTAIAFLSFTLSPIGPVKVFGGFTAIGILFCMIWSLTVIPALLVLIPPRWMMRRRWRGAVAPPSNRVGSFARLGGFVVRHRVAVIVLAFVVAATAPLAVARIKVQDSWIDGFAPESEFYKATEYFNDHFLGTHILLICVDAGHHLLTGTLNASAITYQSIAFPGDLVDDPQTLVDQRIRMTLSEATLRARKARRRGGRPSKWFGRIESARREADRILVKVSRKRGLARASLRLTGGEFVDYEITPQPMMTPAVLRRIGALETFIAGEKESTVGGVLGTADYLATANFMSRGRKESERVIPDNPDRIEWVWSQYQRIRGVERRQQIVDGNYARSLVTVFMKNANFIGTERLMNRVREYEKEHLLPHGIKLEFAGDVAVSQTLIAAIVKTQTVSLLLSLVGITAITALMGGSLVWGLLCVLPCALAVLVNFAVMGLVGMPLGVATSMFAGMTLGIGVDYSIHLLERFRRARSRGLAIEEALTDAVAATGPAIFIDALAVALGFGVLTLSQVPANARLGGLVVLSIVGCFVATLLLLPAIIATFSARNRTAATSSTGC